MPQTYFDSELTGEQIEAALEAVNGIASMTNNGKILYINNGRIDAKSAAEWADVPVLEPVTITQNGTTTPPAGVDGFNSVTVNVQGGGSEAVVQPLSVTANGTYNPPSGVDGYAPVTVNVQGGGGGGGSLVTPAYQGLSYCYVNSNGNSFYQGVNKNQYIQFYTVQANHFYALFVGFIVGTRRRASFFPGKTFADFEPYIDTQPQSETQIFSGEWLAPFVSGTDDTGNALAGRIMAFASQNGVIVYGTDNTGARCPAYCVDLGEAQGVDAYCIYTKSTGGSDAAIYVAKGKCNTSTGLFTPTENPVSVIYTSVQSQSNFYNIGGIATLDYHSAWQVYATAAITDGTDNYTAGARVKQWAFSTKINFIIYESQ